MKHMTYNFNFVAQDFNWVY